MGPWFSPQVVPFRRAFLSAIAITALAARPVSAQGPPPEPTGSKSQAQERQRLDMACWRGAPRPTCGGFFVVEMQSVMPLFQSHRGQVDWSHSYQMFKSQVEWNLGYMENVTTHWAVGATLSMGSGADGVLTGLKARARRWLGPQRSLELEGGTFRKQAHHRSGDVTGFTAGARFNLGDRGSFFVRWDGVDVPGFLYPPPGAPHPGGFQQAIHVGVGSGSTWAVGTTAALGLGYLALIMLAVTWCGWT